MTNEAHSSVLSPEVIRRSSFLVLLVAALFGLALPVHADLTITQQVEGSGLAGEMIIRIKGGKTRADLPQNASILTDAETGDTLLLQHRSKSYTRIAAEQTKALAEQLQKAQAGAAPPKLQATGEKKEISGHQTVRYTWTAGAMTLHFWVAKDYPNGAAIQEQLDRLQNAGLASVAAGMMPKSSEMPGIRLRTEMQGQGQKVSYTIKTIKEDEVDPALFEVPKDYTEAPAPLIPPAAK